MGWSKIAKEHFHSDREDTADAAYRALVEPDPKRPIEAKLMFEFVKMEVAAEGMYSSVFKPSQFAGSLGSTIVGMSMHHKARIDEMRQQAIEEENIRKTVEYQMKRQRITKRNGSQRKLVSLYPSPDHSSCSSPEPTLVLSETEEDETVISPPGTAAGRKRHRSLSSDTRDSHADNRHKYVISVLWACLDLTEIFFTEVSPPHLR
jgi:C-terminal domain of homeodomain 1